MWCLNIYWLVTPHKVKLRGKLKISCVWMLRWIMRKNEKEELLRNPGLVYRTSSAIVSLGREPLHSSAFGYNWVQLWGTWLEDRFWFVFYSTPRIAGQPSHSSGDTPQPHSSLCFRRTPHLVSQSGSHSTWYSEMMRLSAWPEKNSFMLSVCLPVTETQNLNLLLIRDFCCVYAVA